MIGAAAKRFLPQIVAWGAAMLLLDACGGDDSPPEEPHFRRTEPEPDNQIAPRNCRFTLTTRAEDVSFSEPFRDFSNSPYQPVNICVKHAVDRNQLVFSPNSSGRSFDLSGIVKWASFPRLLEEKNWSAICRDTRLDSEGEVTPNLDDCQKVIRYTNRRALGRDLFQQAYELSSSGAIGNWGTTFTDQLDLLRRSQAESIGPHSHAIGLAEFLETDPAEPPVANISLDLESTVAGDDGYTTPIGYYYFGGFRYDPNNLDNPNNCIPVVGQEIETPDGEIGTFPFYEDEIPVLFTRGVQFLYQNVSGAGTYQATACEGDCPTIMGIFVGRLYQEMIIACDGQDASP